MRIGISVTSAHRVDDPREGARNMVERAATAASAGLTSLFIGDHHVTPTPYYQNTAILGRMLAEWNDQPAGALYLLPLWHPVLLAEQIATLAAIMQGRFILQCAIGDLHQRRAMGMPLRDGAQMLTDSLDIMRRLWRGETVSEDRFWQINEARISPLPADPVEVWVGASAPAAINRAARVAEGWLASPGLTLDQARDSLNHFQQACAEHNRAPAAVAIRKDIYVGLSSAQARSVVQPYIDRGYRGMNPQALVYGSVNEVADQIQQLADLGYTDVIVRNLTSDQSEALACIERLADVRSALE
ncbi:MAG: LLM class flavin-dependent oxidoreductase [Proteobacteria bacterium]|nr:LLM class flavin-dependent oxidoreductase [Pseudomonadota bacterium]